MSFIKLWENSSEKRPLKGQSLFKFPDDYVIFDLETTGLDPIVDDILEIGAIKVVNNEIVDTFQKFCMPDDLSMISDFIQRLTGITPEMLKGADKPTRVINEFTDFIGNSILLGYNIHFDVNFLYDEALTRNMNPITNNLVDVLRFSKRYFSDLPDYKLKTVAQELLIDTTGNHRALADCHITHNLYQHIKKEVATSEKSVREFYRKNQNKCIKLKAKDIVSCKADFDTAHPLFEKNCVFTGTLKKMNRKQAMQYVVDFGGINGSGVTKKTNYLILGNNDYCPLIKNPNGKSSKQLKAEKLKIEGHDIEIISENVFYDMLEM